MSVSPLWALFGGVADVGEREFGRSTDDGAACGRAKDERDWLHDRQPGSGAFTLWSTYGVLREAARHPGWIAGGLSWEQVYDKMRPYDDGLRPRDQLRRSSS